MASNEHRAERIQIELLDHTTQLAKALARPASDRNGETIRAQWRQIDRLRAPLNSAYRSLRKTGRGADGAARISQAQRDLKRELDLLRKRLRLWDEMSKVVERHIAAQAHPLDLVRDGNDSDPMLTMMYQAVHRLANPNMQSEIAVKNDYFPDIPLRIQLFEQLTLAAYRLLVARGRSEGARFIDVGCGGGTKVFAATRFFADCVGLEYDPAYVQAAERCFALLNAGTCSVIQGDALNYDGYDAFDVIYFYRPVKDIALLAQMEARIIAQARRGTIIIAPYDQFMTPHAEWPCANITGPIFVTGMTQAEADEWHLEATQTEAALVRRPRDIPFDPGFWTPLMHASRYGG